MEGKGYELPDDITGLGGMVTWADEAGQWNTEVFRIPRGRSLRVPQTRQGRRPRLPFAPGREDR